MENTKKPNIAVNLWNNWCSMDPNQRSIVAERLGPIGHVLSIAANVNAFAQQSQNVDNLENARKKVKDEDDDIIDVEFEECDP